MSAETEDNYDFDAPMFVDFSTGHIDQQDSDIDKWFNNRDGDGGGFEDSLEEDNGGNAESGTSEQPQEPPKENEHPRDPIDSKKQEPPVEVKGATVESSSEEKKGKTPTNPFIFFEDKRAPNCTEMPSWKPRFHALQTVASAKQQDEPPSKKKKAEPLRKRTISSGHRRSVRLSGKKESRSVTTETKRPTRVKPMAMPKMKAPMLTIPSTPNMMRRVKNTNITSTVHKPKEELELETIANMQKGLKDKRKQNEEFMKKALSAGNYMPHRSVGDNLTQAHEFHFELDKRIKKQQHNPNEGKEKNFFESLRQHPISPEKPLPFKAQPVPEFDKMQFKPDLQHQATKQQPFSFNQRDKEMGIKKEEKIQAVLEEEKKNFHRFQNPNTKFEPFNLTTDNRGVHKAEQWVKKVEEELQEQRKKAVFKAHSSNVLYQPPFVPKKSLKSNTVFEEFNLNSERRAQDRAVYEMNKREKEMEDEQLILQREAEREEEERKNIEMLRKQLVHKANPIRNYKQVSIMASDRPLTQPESPIWNTREKKSMRI
ncbi:hypothetical protein QZH41_000797 [Actinostola sp. cb2023]|nr:hypothetical protein QZH41_000797 [Actinostola sp. cb2023]